ncbi:hypothetical protein DPMN_015092 [Dreissena polymorpha]|uniref:Uncharacterized protein n=1 Tax=Dreissena polymorpha TaxID=45954 RepID=A0A9D4S445_DREPO|nr:hypothetical protein DPMN_015092 [Dreissena polymorpha]
MLFEELYDDIRTPCCVVDPPPRTPQSRQHSPCKRGVPGLSPGLAAHFSPTGDNCEQNVSPDTLGSKVKVPFALHLCRITLSLS